ncbi:MAG: methyl-accepting chemotaxis protein [Bacillota bacterium]
MNTKKSNAKKKSNLRMVRKETANPFKKLSNFINNSIKRRLVVHTLFNIFILAVMIISLSSTLISNSTINAVEDSVTQLARISAKKVSDRFDSYALILSELSTNSIVTSGTTATYILTDFLAEKSTFYSDSLGTVTFMYFDAEGVDSVSGFSISGTEYFTNAMNGNTIVSDPFLNGESVIYPIATKVLSNGHTKGVLVCFVSMESIAISAETAKLSDWDYPYILNQQGTVVYGSYAQNVIDKHNAINMAKSNSAYANIASIEQAAINGTSHLGYDEYDGDPRIVVSYPIESAPGWTLMMSVDPTSFTASVPQSTAMLYTITTVVLLISAYFVVRMAKVIIEPIHICVDRLQALTNGDIHSPVPIVPNEDEAGLLIDSTRTIVDTLNAIVQDMNVILNGMANGNFAVKSVAEDSYIGDFQPLILSIHNIQDNLAMTINTIDSSAGRVNAESASISNNAQSIAQSTTEQASTIDSLSLTIDETAEQIKGTTNDAVEAQKLALLTSNEMKTSSKQMERMMESMDNLVISSNEIAEIIGTIDSIAFQTNILALNAAVEAARAGQAGKGFAVVADEVRNLANKSAESANSTSGLITNSLQVVEESVRIAKENAKSIESVSKATAETVNLIEKIANASVEQSAAVDQIVSGIHDISATIQGNAAVAEESAAASVELSTQSEKLTSLVETFIVEEID